jgi:spore coat polysaccharide biosynthesis predicted glycosyltransferase SpsG
VKNILKTSAITPAYIAKTDKYFKTKSPLFDTFDEFFLHIGSIINKTHKTPQEMVELAIEDIVFASQDEMMGHVSLYFEFHNKLVKFLELLEDSKDEDELIKKISAVSSALIKLSNTPKDKLASLISDRAKELIVIVFDDYGISYADQKAIKVAFKDKFLQEAILDAVAKIEKLEREDGTLKESLELLKLTLLLSMFFYRLRKENKAGKKWK